MKLVSLCWSFLAIYADFKAQGVKFDFEDGKLDDWNPIDGIKGTAFDDQPIFGDNPKARGDQPANPQGNWSISTYESRNQPDEDASHFQGNNATGGIESPIFIITGDCLSFLIGGGCDISVVKVVLELPEMDKELRQTGKCKNTMERRTMNTSTYKGQEARILLVDVSQENLWGHISFDDLTDDPKYCNERIKTTQASTTVPLATTASRTARTVIQKYLNKVRQLDETNPSSLQEAFSLTVNLSKNLEDPSMDRENSNFLLAIRALEEFGTEYAILHLNENEILTKADANLVWIMRKLSANAQDVFIRFPDSGQASGREPSDYIALPKSFFRNQSRVFNGLFFQDKQKILNENARMFEMELTNTKLDSPVIAVALEPDSGGILEDNTTIVFNHLKEPETSEELRCVFWNFTLKTQMNGSWSRAGCTLKNKTATQTVCTCNHLTSFAILLQTAETKISKEDKKALNIITYVGCSLSLLGEALTIVAYLVLIKFEGEMHSKTHLRLNLAVSMALAQITFLSGVESATSNRDVCIFVAVLMHYLFLAAFDWMLLEGLFLYLKVVKVFNVVTKMAMFYVFAWGFPVIIVILSIIIASTSEGGIKSYVREDNFCWISFSNNLVWTFVAPVLFVCLVNIIILGLVVREMKKLQNVGSNKEGISNMRLALKMLVVLFPLLGLTWIFGVLTVTDSGIVFQYLFTILNSLQGFFIFVIHVLRSSEIREAFWKQKQRLQARKESSFPSNNSGPPSQGRGLHKRSVSPDNTPQPAKTENSFRSQNTTQSSKV